MPNPIKNLADQIAGQLQTATATTSLMQQLLGLVGAITLPYVIVVSQTHAIIVYPGYGPLDAGNEEQYVQLADLHQP